MKFDFELKTSVRVGPGRVQELPEILKEEGFKMPYVLVDVGVWDQVYPLQEKISLAFTSYKSGEPTYQELDQWIYSIQNPPYDCVVGIGGGSTIDVAKGLAILATNKVKNSTELRGFPDLKCKPLPVIAVPTTAGTGSEVTYNAVFTDLFTKKKLGINSRLNYPKHAILDPDLIRSCPEEVMLSACLDALVHAVESYSSTNASEYTHAFSCKAYQLLIEGWTTWFVYQMTADLQLGAHLAAIALMNAGSGPSGMLSYPLGVRFNIPHGIAGGLTLRKVVEFNMHARSSVFFEGLRHNMSNAGVLTDLDIFHGKLGDYGVKEADLDLILDDTIFKDPAQSHPFNPVPFRRADARKILEECL